MKTLDVVVGNTFEDDPVALSAWKRDRRVNSKAKGTTRPAPVPESPVGETVAAPAIVDAPLALAPEDPLRRAS